MHIYVKIVKKVIVAIDERYITVQFNSKIFATQLRLATEKVILNRLCNQHGKRLSDRYNYKSLFLILRNCTIPLDFINYKN